MSRELRFLAVLTSLLAFAPLARAQPAERYTSREVIVKLRSPAQDTAALRAGLGASVKQTFRSTGAELWSLGTGDVPDAVDRLSGDPRVEYAEPNYIVRAHDLFPNDPRFNQQWGLFNKGDFGGTSGADIDAPAAWSILIGGNVLIGVVDSGVDWQHGDLAGNIYTNPGEIPGNFIDDDDNGYVDDVHGWDFVNEDNDPRDDNGHGTHIAGIIAAQGNNATGGAGVCWSARILPIKMLDGEALGRLSDAVEAIEYATRMGVHLTNNSWGGMVKSYALRDAIATAEQLGILCIASAGNEGRNCDLYPVYPASYEFDNVISVASTDRSDHRPSFSNFGVTSVDLAAPGAGIVSTTVGNAYEVGSGTSMSAAFVSGAVGLLWARAPRMTAAEVKAALLASVDPLPALAGELRSGGRLNVRALLQALDAVAPAPVSGFAVTEMGSSTARLQWTASGDDGATGTARAYDLRYATTPITPETFGAATRVNGVAAPRLSGSAETWDVSGLDVLTAYYFAIVVEDETGNRSPISAVAGGTTLATPRIAFAPAALDAVLFTGGTAMRTLTLVNAAGGVLEFAAGTPPPWLRMTPSSGRIAGAQAVQVKVTFDARDLPGGLHTSSIDIATNDPAQPGVSIATSLQVTGAPDIDVSSTLIDFGDSFTQCVTETLTVTNRGVEPLVTSGITLSDGPFVSNVSAFLLPPGESRAIPVLFCASVPGRYSATLTVHSDDPDEPDVAVLMKGRTTPPPALVASPPSLSATVVSGGLATRTLHIANNGGGTLDFEVAVMEPGGPQVAAPGSAGVTERVVAVGRPLSRDELRELRASFPSRISTAGTLDEIDARGARANVPSRASALHAANGTRLEEVFGSTDNLFVGSGRSRGNFYTCTKSTNLVEHRFYMQPLSSGDIWFLVYEGMGQTGAYELISGSDVSPSGTEAGWYSSGKVQVPLVAGRYYLIVASFEPFTNYYVEDVLTPYPFPASFGDLTAGAGVTWAPATGFPPALFQFVTPVAFDAHVAYYQTLITEGVVGWASTSHGAGTLAPHSSTDVTVSLRAGPGFPEGDHTANLRITSNDPAVSKVIVPVQFHVNGAADIALSQNDMVYGDCFTGVPNVDTLVVSNSGTRTLHVTGIVSSRPEFTPSLTSFTLVENANINVPVTFASTSTAAVNGTLTITSDDPDETVVVVTIRAQATRPPVMSVSPPSVVASLMTGSDLVHTLSIHNSGPSPLSFAIDTETIVSSQRKPAHDKKPEQAASQYRTPRSERRSSTSAWYSAKAVPSLPGGKSSAEIIATSGSYSVLLVNAAVVDDIQGWLQTFPDLPTVDTFDAATETPSFGQLAAYDAVVLINDFEFFDPVSLGNVLADYVDQGGGVVLTLASFVNGFEIAGRLVDGGYLPLMIGGGPGGTASLGDYRAGHPIMAGVASVEGSVRGITILEPGARWVADWTDGQPFVATRASRVVAINAFIADGGFWGGDIPQLLHNAIVWAATPQWLTTDVVEGVVPAHSTVQVPVKLDTDELSAGDYAGTLRIGGNDPFRGEVVIPIALAVEPVPFTGVDPLALPETFALLSNRPNPFNPTTTIAYHLPRAAKVRLVVYDVGGRRVRTLVEAARPAGRHNVVWDGRDNAGRPAASGVYFYRITAGDFVDTKKMVLMK